MKNILTFLKKKIWKSEKSRRFWKQNLKIWKSLKISKFLKQNLKIKNVFFFPKSKFQFFSFFIGFFSSSIFQENIILSIPSCSFYTFVLLAQHPHLIPTPASNTSIPSPNFWILDFRFRISIFDFRFWISILTSRIASHISDLLSDSQIYSPPPTHHLHLWFEVMSQLRSKSTVYDYEAFAKHLYRPFFESVCLILSRLVPISAENFVFLFTSSHVKIGWILSEKSLNNTHRCERNNVTH